MRRVASHPLLHFLLLGAALYGLREAVWPPPAPVPAPVVIGQATLDALRAGWIRSTGRPPSERELDGLVHDSVDEELLVRTAVEAGLHRDDAVVQRRLLRNLRFLEQGEGDTRASDGELLERAFALGLEESDPVARRRLAWRMRERITAAARARAAGHASAEPAPPARAPATPDRIRLSHVFLSRQLRGDRLEADARELYRQLQAEGSPPLQDRSQPEGAGTPPLGDPLLVPETLPLASESELARSLGPDFAAAVFALEPGHWSRPIPSSYGLHLVWVHERRSGNRAAEHRTVTREEQERRALRAALEALRRDVPVVRADRPGEGESG